MSEYRHKETGKVKTQGQWRSHYRAVSLPRTWQIDTLAGLSLEAVLRSPAATTGAYQTSTRDGVTQDANGNWVEKYVARDMFADTTDEDGVTTTKAEHEAAYQARLDATAGEAARFERNTLLAGTDYFALTDVTMNADMTSYRQALRDITTQSGFPNTISWPAEPS